MNVTSADLSRWVAHRRAVVLAVARRVPGVDPELAASHALLRLCAELAKQGHVADPLVFWTAAALDIADQMANEDAATVTDTASAGAVTAPLRTLDLELLSTAVERLRPGEQQLLWDHHVGSRPVAALAEDIGVLPYAANRRLRRAENRLASSFAETHTEAADDTECRSTRAAMHDFVRHRLLPRRRQKVEDHMVGCAGCTRAFVDVRESYWMLRAAAPVLLLGVVTAAKSGGAVAGVAAGTGAAWLTAMGTRAALVVRSALTDPVGLTTTVASGLLVTTAVTTGMAGGVGDVSVFPESGIVSVAATTPDSQKVARQVSPSRYPDVEPTRTRHSAGSLPSDFAAADGVPPGRAKNDRVPPGLAKKESDTGSAAATGDDVPPGLTETDGVPPGLAETDGVPPGLAKKDGVPPGLAKKDGVPPGQTKKDDVPPGQAKKDSIPPGQAKKDDVPPGQAKKNE